MAIKMRMMMTRRPIIMAMMWSQPMEAFLNLLENLDPKNDNI